MHNEWTKMPKETNWNIDYYALDRNEMTILNATIKVGRRHNRRLAKSGFSA
jgi:hypothetical protein